MRLIDADALLENFYKKRNPHEGADRTNQRHRYMQFLGDYEEISNAPTIDAVPVIRCKDCRYYLNSNEKCRLIDTRLHFYERDKRWTEDSFCSWAERREE